MSEPAFSGGLTRRRFVLGLATPFALALTGVPLTTAEAALRERSILLHHHHTGETLNTVYYADGQYRREALMAASYHLRDWRVDKIKPIDPALLDLLWSMRRALDTDGPIQVFCGYRAPETNAMLRRRSRAVARNSLHIHGMAIDLRVPNRSLRALRAAAISLKGGGVGYYPRSGFVHVDTGRIRCW